MICVIEPHSDDAFLSIGQTMENFIKAGERVQIVTVYSGTRKRGRDAESYAKAIGAKWLGLGLIEQGKGVKGDPLSLDDAFAILNEEIIRLEWNKDRLIIPLAVAHPEHHAVRTFIENSVYGKLEYYLDAPYQITQKNSPTVSTLLQGMQVVSYCKPPMRKWRHIPLFKDQEFFFYRNPPEKLRECFELIVEK